VGRVIFPVNAAVMIRFSIVAYLRFFYRREHWYKAKNIVELAGVMRTAFHVANVAGIWILAVP
jgi:hypothetical protein